MVTNGRGVTIFFEPRQSRGHDVEWAHPSLPLRGDPPAGSGDALARTGFQLAAYFASACAGRPNTPVTKKSSAPSTASP